MSKAQGEIGGYFELEHFNGSLYHDDAIALNCGRNAIAYVIMARGIRRIWLPDYLCASVKNACVREGVEVFTYHIEDGFSYSWPRDYKEGDTFLLVDYFGQLSDADIKSAQIKSGGRLIVDESQAFFRRPVAGVDTLYTVRKFFGVADGAYLYTDATLGYVFERDKSFDKMGFVLGRYENAASLYYDEARANNKRFSAAPVAYMSSLTENLLRAVDYDKVRERRERNFAYMHRVLGCSNKLSINERIIGPYMYPYYSQNAPRARESLALEGIYIPLLWPDVLEPGANSGSVAQSLARNILPLPVDQRYGEREMQRVLDALELEGAINR